MSKWYSKYEEVINKLNAPIKEYRKLNIKSKVYDLLHGKDLLTDEELNEKLGELFKNTFGEDLERFEIEDKTYSVFCKSVTVYLHGEIKLEIETSEGRNNIKDHMYYIGDYNNFKYKNMKVDSIEKQLKEYLFNEIVEEFVDLFMNYNYIGKYDSYYSNYNIAVKEYSLNDYPDLLNGYLRNNGDIKGLLNAISILKKLKNKPEDKEFFEYLEEIECDYRNEEVKYEWREFSLT